MNKNVKQSEIQSGERSATCPECGSSNLTCNQEEYKFPYGKGTDAIELSANVEVEKCNDCGFSYIDQTAELACHEAICEHLGVMKPSQIKGLRDYHGLTQSDFSNITGLGEASLSRWERGIVIQNKAYDNYMYLLGLEANLQSIRQRAESSKATKLPSKIFKKPQFRELDVNEEILQRQKSFRLCLR